MVGNLVLDRIVNSTDHPLELEIRSLGSPSQSTWLLVAIFSHAYKDVNLGWGIQQKADGVPATGYFLKLLESKSAIQEVELTIDRIEDPLIDIPIVDYRHASMPHLVRWSLLVNGSKKASFKTQEQRIVHITMNINEDTVTLKTGN